MDFSFEDTNIEDSGVATATATPKPTVTKSPGSGSVTVYVTATGSKYHRDGCRYLAKSKIPMTLAEAKAANYEPCSVCDPPT